MSDPSPAVEKEGLPPSMPPPASQAWFLAFMMVGGLAVATFFVTILVRNFHVARLSQRQSVLRTDERFQDVESMLEVFKSEVDKANAIITAAPRNFGRRQNLMARLKEAEDRKRAMEARMDMEPNEKTQKLSLLEREIAGLQIDVNTTSTDQVDLKMAQDNKVQYCRKIRENIIKLGDLKNQRFWVDQMQTICH